MSISSIRTTVSYATERVTAANGLENNKNNDTAEVSVDNLQQTKQMTIEERQKQLDKSIEKVLRIIKRPETSIERSVHEGTNQVIYKIMNKDSGEVIKEFPEEKLLDLAARIMELSGIVIDERV